MLTGTFTAGCYSYETVTVAVRDRQTSRPIAGAVVHVHPLDPRHPLRPADILNPFTPDDHSGVTDVRGVVRLDAARDQPLEIGVICPGYEPGIVPFKGLPAQPGVASEWTSLYGEESPRGGRLWEISITR